MGDVMNEVARIHKEMKDIETKLGMLSMKLHDAVHKCKWYVYDSAACEEECHHPSREGYARMPDFHSEECHKCKFYEVRKWKE